MSLISIRHNHGRSRFGVLDGDRVIGKAAYQASHALKETVEGGIRIVPVCPYIKSYLGKHPEFGEGVAEPAPEHPAPEHLEFLRTRLEGRDRR